MKIYEIMDSENNLSIGVLQYFEKERACVIELQEYLDEWNAPLLFTSFVKKNVLDTTEVCDILECTRQNVAYMIKRQMLSPVKKEAKGNLYLKGEVLKNKW